MNPKRVHCTLLFVTESNGFSSKLNDVNDVKVDSWVEVGRWRRGIVILGTIRDVISELLSFLSFQSLSDWKISISAFNA